MKKLFTLTVVLAFIVGIAVSPIWAAGGKNHGSVGSGDVNQGDVVNGTSPGDDAKGNQVD